MKYMFPKFTIAVTDQRKRTIQELVDEAHRDFQRESRQPHEYENRGSMCGLCGLDYQAKIHHGG